MSAGFLSAHWPRFSEVWCFHWQACLPLLPLLLGLTWIYRRRWKHHRSLAPAALEAGLASALAVFVPLPFVVPFFALSLVPLTYLALSGFRHGDPRWYQPQLTGLVGLMVAAAYTQILGGVMRAIRSRILGSRRATVVTVAIILVLVLGSLLPVYFFNLESGNSENILCLACNAHLRGQWFVPGSQRETRIRSTERGT